MLLLIKETGEQAGELVGARMRLAHCSLGIAFFSGYVGCDMFLAFSAEVAQLVEQPLRKG